MKIYTKTGDEGNTSSLSGTKYRKNDTVIEANGLIDETLVAIQKAKLNFSDERLLKQWNKIVEALYLLGAEISNGKVSGLNKSIDKGFVAKLEEKIDKYYIPTNSFQYFNTSAALDCEEARVRVRKLERFMTTMLRQNRLRSVVYAYINRLSDYLFVMSVYIENEFTDFPRE